MSIVSGPQTAFRLVRVHGVIFCDLITTRKAVCGPETRVGVPMICISNCLSGVFWFSHLSISYFG